MQFACSTLLFGGYDLEAALAGIKQAGYAALELSAIPGMGDHLPTGAGDEFYAAVQGKLEASGLVLESVGGSGSLGTERFAPLMAAAGSLGTPYLTLSSGGLLDDEISWQESLAAFRAALPICEQTGVRLSVKPHVRQAVYGIATARRFMEELDSEWVGLNLDNTHLLRSGDDPVDAVKQLSPWILTACIRDILSDDLSIGRVESQIPGKGQADVAGYLRALQEVTQLAYVTVEMVGTKDFTLNEVQRVIGEALVALQGMSQSA